jgi:hypothetical protein
MLKIEPPRSKHKNKSGGSYESGQHAAGNAPLRST